MELDVSPPPRAADAEIDHSKSGDGTGSAIGFFAEPSNASRIRQKSVSHARRQPDRIA